MSKLKRGVLILILFISLFLNLNSNELKGENFLITESKKAFLNFYIIDENNKEIPVLDNGLLINSRIFIKDSTRRFYLRDNGKFVISSTEDFFIIKWQVENLEFIESYTIEEDYIDYAFTIKNLSKKGRLVGVYFIYDTYLGESSGKHFIDSEGEVYNREISFQGFDIPGAIKSINENNQGLEFVFPEDRELKPDRVILGNWEQLSRSKKWPYIPSDGGLFSYGYYSINDSGLGLVYPSTSLNEGETTTHRYKIKFYSKLEPEKNVVVEKKDNSKWIKDEEVPQEESKTEAEEELVIDEKVEDEPVVEKEPIVTEEVKEPIDELQEHNVVLEDQVVEEITDDMEPLDPEKEELLRMLEYVRKKKSGEDVSGFDFDEDYILEKLSEIDE